MASRTHNLAGCGSRCRDGRRLFSLEGDFGRSGVRMHRPSLILFCLTLAIALIVAPSAHAHLMNTGFGPFYDGLTHLFVTPEDLLPVIALALLAGLRGPRFGRSVLFALPAAWLVGSTAGLLLAPQLTLPGAEIILTIGLGALLAADRPLPLGFVVGFAILLGLLHGTLHGSELAKTLSSAQMNNAGVVVALFVSVSLLAGQAASVRVRWARTAVRVAGSWIAAIGLLMLGWAMRVPG
jgi:urease accessory protein